MSEPQDPQLAGNPLCVESAKRTRADKPRLQSSALGVVAQSCFPGAPRRTHYFSG